MADDFAREKIQRVGVEVPALLREPAEAAAAALTATTFQLLIGVLS